MAEDLQEYFSHFSIELSQKIKKYATDDVLKDSRYIFVTREGKRQYGYCTHCQNYFETERNLYHNGSGFCPSCGSICTVKSSGRGRKCMVDEAYFVYYEKSLIDPNTIIARGVYALRDYRGNYKNVKTQYLVVAMYIFKPGSSVMLKRDWFFYSDYDSNLRYTNFVKTSSIWTFYRREHFKSIYTAYSRKSVEEAVEDTPFRYSTWEDYTNCADLTEFFGLYSKYPCIEYLTKLGFKNLVLDKMDGKPTYGTINWRGKTLLKVLKISKQELNEIRQQPIDITFNFLRILQISKKRQWELPMLDVYDVSQNDNTYFVGEFEKLLVYGPAKKILGYITKQYNGSSTKSYNPKYWALLTWRDYIEDCKKLEMDLTQEAILFPKDVYKAHQETIKRVKIKTDTETNRKIMSRGKVLEKLYCFKYKKLMIRPAVNYQELLAEGSALSHCVASYAVRYSDGETDILFIRKITEPDKPFFTVEIKNGKINQVRGKNNCIPTDEVNEFTQMFEKTKLRKMKRENRTAIERAC